MTLKVLVAMSGGVDSAVTAALLKKQGFKVAGITMAHLPVVGDGRNDIPDAADEAARLCRKLDIPHEVIDLRDPFQQEIISDFCRAYTEGKTPNPCIRCNQHIKFGLLLEEAVAKGFDYLATGHYARIEKGEVQYFLRKGIDHTKDQSYFLYRLTQAQMAQILMPLGTMTKVEVRQIALDMGLDVAEKKESQEICFIPDNDYVGFLLGHLPQSAMPGPIIDSSGKTLGKHRGIIRYTIGQRRGLGIAAPEPLYVTRIDAARNVVIVGSKEDTYSSVLTARDAHWISPQKPSKSFKARAKIRYLHQEAEAGIIPRADSTIYVEFEKTQMAITPGQSVVLYEGDTVLGGATIE